jgi:hypothetical protein
MLLPPNDPKQVFDRRINGLGFSLVVFYSTDGLKAVLIIKSEMEVRDVNSTSQFVPQICASFIFRAHQQM